jgi:nitrite reductase (NO-forming)
VFNGTAGVLTADYPLKARVGETVRIFFGVDGPNATSSFHVIGEFKLDVPGRYILVDHALSRLERGLAGVLVVDGAENPAVFHGEGTPSMAGH